ncbi:MAG: adenine phosphoribosyltransferase [Anaerolineales bacterium]|nr:adenine phosphoribosyltransferase [Chloroflexota bacterium]MBL6981274.1 adenine phosphoribosyltransferase [Anaerolineales bacterium]
MISQRSVYPIEIAGVYRELRLFEVQAGLRIAILNILGDTELVSACAVVLREKLAQFEYDVIVTAEAKSIPLAHELARVSDKPYVVLRKHYRSYMGKTIQAETISITTGQTQNLYLDEKDISLIQGKKAILLDDVISTGSTLEGMQQIIQNAEGQLIAMAAILTEGDQEKWKGVVSLGHLPLFTD